MSCMNCGGALRDGLKFCPACGTPAPQGATFTPPPEQTPPEQMRTSWNPPPAAAPPRRKSRAGKILLVVFGVFLLLVAGAGVAVFYGVRHFANKIKTSEPYRVAEKELRENVVANGVLGGIRSTGFPIGVYNTEADGSGQAAFTMTVEGSLAKGQYNVELVREAGAWRVLKAQLQMPDGTVHPLVNDGVSGGGPNSGVGPAGGPPPPPVPFDGKPGSVVVPGAVDVGELDGKALSKPEPTYPAAARTVRAKGKVVVRVTLDESGQVIMAAPVGGPPLLLAAAVAAARRARFPPTVRNGRAVKAIGTLTYEFE